MVFFRKRGFRYLSNYTEKFLADHLPPEKLKSLLVSRDSRVIGAVKLGQDVSIFPYCVLRADINFIQIGNRTNVQDGTVIHVTSKLPVIIGNDVSIGHKAIIHACTIEDTALVGMGAILLDGCHIGKESIVAAGSVVTMGKTFPARSLLMGNPARRVRDVSEAEISNMKQTVEKYIKVAQDLGRMNIKENESLQIDAYETNTSLVVFADVPGVCMEEGAIKWQIQNDCLTLVVYRERPNIVGNVIQEEKYYGESLRNFYDIAKKIDPAIEPKVTLANGVLQLTFAKKMTTDEKL